MEDARAPEPKGRGALLQALYERRKREATPQGVGATAQETRAPRVSPNLTLKLQHLLETGF